ncbi:MAG: family 1 glycosylhydrolase, partial [Anaerolineales bacterium]
PKIYITENGAAFPDQVTPDGRIIDTNRLAYIHGHIDAVAKAIEMGVPVAGYFVWSMFDNFEWAFGYDMRFGIVHVNLDTQQRIPKQSALWYREVIRNHGIPEG